MSAFTSELFGEIREQKLSPLGKDLACSFLTAISQGGCVQHGWAGGGLGKPLYPLLLVTFGIFSYETISMPVKLGVIIQVKLLLQSHGRGFPRYKVLVALICLSSHLIDVSPLLFPLQMEMRYQINQPLVNTIFHKALTCLTFFTCLVGGLLKSGKIL